MADPVKQALQERQVAFSELPNGDIFFRRSDGHGMYVRPHPDGSYDWSVNAALNDTNLMDFRAPERRSLRELIQRIDDFLGLVVSGSLVIDTLGLVQRSMEQGLSREQAENVVKVAREFALEMHESGMDAREIRSRFDEFVGQLRSERESGDSQVGTSGT